MAPARRMQIGAAIFAHRCADGNKHNLGFGNGTAGIGGKVQGF